MRPERRGGVRSTCGGYADARRLMAVVGLLWRRELPGRRRGSSLMNEIDETVHTGAFSRNRALVAVARALLSDGLPEPLRVSACSLPLRRQGVTFPRAVRCGAGAREVRPSRGVGVRRGAPASEPPWISYFAYNPPQFFSRFDRHAGVARRSDHYVSVANSRAQDSVQRHARAGRDPRVQRHG